MLRRNIMPVVAPTQIKIRVEFVTQPKKKITAEKISRRLLPWNEVSHEISIDSIGQPAEPGRDILGVEFLSTTPIRDWFWDSGSFPFALDADTEILEDSGWVKIIYTSTQDGSPHTDTACYKIDPTVQQNPAEVTDIEFVLRETAPGVIKLIFPEAGGPGAAPICAQLQVALGSVPPGSLSAASYRVALIANIC
jgi:hypothetical protein